MEDCVICKRPLGIAYFGKKIRKKYCCIKCENYSKKHECSYPPCYKDILNTTNNFCSEDHKINFFNSGPKPVAKRKCTICKILKNNYEFRIKYTTGWKDVLGLQRNPHCRNCENQHQKNKRDKDPYTRLFLLARRRAVRDNLQFNITVDYIKEIWPKNNCCPIFNTPFKTGLKNKYLLPTIDKIKPAIGYVKGNIAIISFRANRLKSDITDINLFKKIYDFYTNF